MPYIMVGHRRMMPDTKLPTKSILCKITNTAHAKEKELQEAKDQIIY